MLAEARAADRVGGDKLYDTKGFVAFANSGRPRTQRRSAIDARTTRANDVSQSGAQAKEIFGWGKDVGPRKTKFRGKDRVGFQLLLTVAGYNLALFLPRCRHDSRTVRNGQNTTSKGQCNGHNSIARHNQRHCLFDNDHHFQCDFQQPASNYLFRCQPPLAHQRQGSSRFEGALRRRRTVRTA